MNEKMKEIENKVFVLEHALTIEGIDELLEMIKEIQDEGIVTDLRQWKRLEDIRAKWRATRYRLCGYFDFD